MSRNADAITNQCDSFSDNSALECGVVACLIVGAQVVEEGVVTHDALAFRPLISTTFAGGGSMMSRRRAAHSVNASRISAS